MRKTGKSIQCGMVKNWHTMVQEGEKMVYRRVGKTNLFTVERSVTWSKFCLGFCPPPSQLHHSLASLQGLKAFSLL